MDGHASTQPTTLPGGAPLAPGEAPLVGASFMLSTVAFYLHTELALTNRRLASVRPQTLFGLIPIGTTRQSFPIENIAGVSSATRFDLLGVVVGVFGLCFGIAVVTIPSLAILGVLLALISLGAIIGAPKQAIEVMNSGGGLIRFPVSVLERSRTVEFANRMAESVARTAGSAASPSRAGAAATDALPGDPSEALQQLARLRDQGLISVAEYSAKRSEILARI